MTDPDLSARALESLTDATYVLDRDRRIQLWNAAATAVTGHEASTVVGRQCGDGLLNHVDEAGATLCGSRCPLAATMRDGAPREARVFVHHRDGHLVPVRINASAVRDEAGSIVGAVETFRDDTDPAAVARRIAELEALAMLDPLTSVGNRRYLDSRLVEALDALESDAVGFGAILLDLDHFKDVNDTYGHGIGDEVLRSVARTLTAAVAPDDAVARFGGEEFVVLTRVGSVAELGAVARRIRLMVGHSWHHHEGGRFHVTISGGLTTGLPGDTPATVLARADAALLQAKREGRNRTRIG